MSVTDGDTCNVRRSSGDTVTIRLHGVDAPETSQPGGKAATRAARRYVSGRNVRVEVEDIGRYSRAVARTNVQGGDLSAMLIRGGHGWYYEQYAPNVTEYARRAPGEKRQPGHLVSAESHTTVGVARSV